VARCVYECKCTLEYVVKGIELTTNKELAEDELEDAALLEAVEEVYPEEPDDYDCSCDLVDCDDEAEVDEE